MARRHGGQMARRHSSQMARLRSGPNDTETRMIESMSPLRSLSRSTWVGRLFTVIALTLVATTGCTDGDGPTEAEVEAWLQTQTQTSDEEDLLGEVRGTAQPGNNIDNASWIDTNFPNLVSVTGIEITCFGAESARFAIRLSTPTDSGGAMTSTSTTEPYTCDKSTHALAEVAELAQEGDAVSVGVAAVDVKRDTAWRAIIYGDEVVSDDD